ncbi:hypothetical protein NC653_002422 [Populus alba x Populus x berolinensis]|uniref:Uncharacterized protein n=1 Tax=Populus alba x Populus x berolinensis TaxID=444605 RepID=A0AAD6RNU7_9ROSI|nr:hypothetical protein NC653_002422 [Populus alba x Populus x berolinensis]
MHIIHFDYSTYILSSICDFRLHKQVSIHSLARNSNG